MLQQAKHHDKDQLMRIEISPNSVDAPLEYVSQNYAPQIVAAGLGFSRATYEHSILSLRIFEAARTRVAQINGCQLCQNWRSARDTAAYVDSLGGSRDTIASRDHRSPDEAFYAAVAEWRDAAVFDSRERVAIEYAERLCLEPQILAQDEPFWRRAKSALSDAEIVDLSYCIACWMGLGRVAHVLGIDNACQIPALARDHRMAS
jgi:alkylhydroperoxidase family enzyme